MSELDKRQRNWSPVPLAVCEACSLVWSIVLVTGTTYLTGWQGWSGWTWVGAVFLLTGWTCKWSRYPGTAKEDNE